MRIKFTILVFFVYTPHLFSQSPTSPAGGENYSTEFSITDAHGRPFSHADENVEGSAYFLDNLTNSIIRFSKGQSFQSIPTRFDLYRHELHVLSRNHEEFILPNGLVKEFVIHDSTTNQPKEYIFRAGYPPIDKQDENNFYLVLTQG